VYCLLTYACANNSVSLYQGDALYESVIHHNLSLHHNILSVSPDDLVELKLVRPADLSRPLPRADIMLNATSNLILASYRNQSSHVFVRVAMVALAVNGCTKREVITMGEVFTARQHSLLCRALY